MNRNLVVTVVLSTVILSCGVVKNTSKEGEGTGSVIIEDGKKGEGAKIVGIPAYQTAETRTTDLLHTRLNVSFDWAAARLLGDATIDLKPYFHAQSTVILDAKGFDIHKVAIVKDGEKADLKYAYDDLELVIELDREYTRAEQYQLYIEYTAKPDERETGGSSAITSDKGLYFINPDGKVPNLPQMIWTQGETESNSCWFPTIDVPNERMTQEIYMTVDSKYKTLSNGLLIFSIDNGDGTRTDYWKQELGHAPYLAMMAVGEFAVIKDKWTRKDSSAMEVHYYVDPEYAAYGQAMFDASPAMLQFYSDVLMVEYPWDKYHQIVVKEFVSGAMENTSAVIHGDFLHKTSRELLDSDNEAIIAHEMFHHWFGDLVTCESWSNLPLNESFATYGEYLWYEHGHGRTMADFHGSSSMDGYIALSHRGKHDLIWFDYKDKEDMFDGHSYNKGGRILHMLRKYLGDDAFFESLKYYLEKNKFTSVEIHDLRLACEEISGEDLNWFFNQWFLSSGHPDLEIEQGWDAMSKTLVVTLTQKQDLKESPLFRLPLDIDIYLPGKVERKKIVMDQSKQDFVFQLDTAPLLVNVDAEKQLLCEKVDKKPLSQFVYQYYNAPLYLDRKEALIFCGDFAKDDTIAAKVVRDALKDDFFHLRLEAIRKLRHAIPGHKDEIKASLRMLASSDPKARVRSSAIRALGKHFADDKELMEVFRNALTDSSYGVWAAALEATATFDPKEAMKLAKGMEGEKIGTIRQGVAQLYSAHGGEDELEFFKVSVKDAQGFSKFGIIRSFNNYILLQNDETITQGLPMYLKTVKESTSPWMKRATVQGMLDVETMYKKKEAEANKNIDEAKANQEGLEMVVQLERDLNSAKNQLKRINDIKEQIKQTETNENVLRMIGG